MLAMLMSLMGQILLVPGFGGGATIPANALLDENGSPLLDELGNMLLGE